jgi:acetyltransferase
MVFDQEKAGKLIAGAPPEGFVSEADAEDILTAYGLPMIRTEIATTEAKASHIGREVGYPLVMKLHSPNITHKTDADGVRLDLRCDADVCRSYNEIISSAGRYKPEARIEAMFTSAGEKSGLRDSPVNRRSDSPMNCR